MVEIPDADPALLKLLRMAGDEWGPAGVAEIAAKLAEPPDPEPEPPPQPTRMTGGSTLPVGERAWSPAKQDTYRFGFG